MPAYSGVNGGTGEVVEVEGSCQMGALMLTVIRPTSICQECFMVYGSISQSSKLILYVSKLQYDRYRVAP